MIACHYQQLYFVQEINLILDMELDLQQSPMYLTRIGTLDNSIGSMKNSFSQSINISLIKVKVRQ